MTGKRRKNTTAPAQPSLWGEPAGGGGAAAPNPPPPPPPVLRFRASIRFPMPADTPHELRVLAEELVHRYCDRVWAAVNVATGRLYRAADGAPMAVVDLDTYSGPRLGPAEVRYHALAVAGILRDALRVPLLTAGRTRFVVDLPGETLTLDPAEEV